MRKYITLIAAALVATAAVSYGAISQLLVTRSDDAIVRTPGPCKVLAVDAVGAAGTISISADRAVTNVYSYIDVMHSTPTSTVYVVATNSYSISRTIADATVPASNYCYTALATPVVLFPGEILKYSGTSVDAAVTLLIEQ